MRTSRRWRGLSAFCRRAAPAALGIQLAHAGRKGSARLPWESGGAWATVAPSAIRFDDHWPAPQALDEAGLARIRDAHANAAKRADRLGFDLVELLAAHSFLLHSFLSPTFWDASSLIRKRSVSRSFIGMVDPPSKTPER
jgi:2,4-dienoyl-CoA reductase-like NADH-dependent reductase (Old Yellow Enzyme family)